MKVTLKAARINANLNIKEAARLYGISPKTLWNYENYKTTPKREFVEKIPKIYNCKIDDIIFFPNKCGLTSKSEKDN
jgi:transcriptional regulator with XRE-family HTH domain